MNDEKRLPEYSDLWEHEVNKNGELKAEIEQLKEELRLHHKRWKMIEGRECDMNAEDMETIERISWKIDCLRR